MTALLCSASSARVIRQSQLATENSGLFLISPPPLLYRYHKAWLKSRCFNYLSRATKQHFSLHFPTMRYTFLANSATLLRIINMRLAYACMICIVHSPEIFLSYILSLLIFTLPCFFCRYRHVIIFMFVVFWLHVEDLVVYPGYVSCTPKFPYIHTHCACVCSKILEDTWEFILDRTNWRIHRLP